MKIIPISFPNTPLKNKHKTKKMFLQKTEIPVNKMDQVGVERSNVGGGRDFVSRDCEEEFFLHNLHINKKLICISRVWSVVVKK